MATLQAAKIPFAEDPSNRDPRFARARFRAFMPALAAEGLTPARLAQLAERLKRADEAIEAAVDQLADALAAPALAPLRRGAGTPISLAAADWAKAPTEIRLRLLGRLVAITGDEGDIELAKLEACEQAVAAHLHARSSERFRRTLAGAVITLAGDRLTVGRAPPRRKARSARREDATRARGITHSPHSPSAGKIASFGRLSLAGGKVRPTLWTTMTAEGSLDFLTMHADPGAMRNAR